VRRGPTWRALPLEIATRSSDRRTAARWGSAFALRETVANRLEWTVEHAEGRPCVHFSTRLPRGSYLLWIPPGQGLYETQYPIEVRRDRAWKETCELAEEEAPPLPPGMEPVDGVSAAKYWRFVPAGPFDVSGDRDSTQSPKRREAWIRVPEKGDEGLYVARFEVTSAMYRAYLDDASWHGLAASFPHVPRQNGVASEETAYWRHGEQGYRPLPELTWWTDEMPVHSISWADADDFCGWLTGRSGGGRWRFQLPTQDEWEKAARGPSGRFFPWGDAFDPTFCRSFESRTREQQETMPEPIALYPIDESPYGVRDLAGGMREWTSSRLEGPAPWRITKGGSWAHGSGIARSAGLTANAPENVFPSLGFRIVARRRGP